MSDLFPKSGVVIGTSINRDDVPVSIVITDTFNLGMSSSLKQLKLTIGPTAPSNPVVGDLWIETLT
jgi:hypothetical protein